METQWEIGVIFGAIVGLIELAKILAGKIVTKKNGNDNDYVRREIEKILEFVDKHDRQSELKWLTTTQWQENMNQSVKNLSTTIKDTMRVLTSSSDNSSIRRLFEND